MKRIQLATLLSWADEEGIQGRKRLQKVVFFLQNAGCPLDCQYTLHYFGPYSRDVADACDEMVAAGLIEERVVLSRSFSYTYRLAPTTRELLTKTTYVEMQKYEELGKRLIKEDLARLELGSTILYFYSNTDDWDTALIEACKYKSKNPDDGPSQAALKFAQEMYTKSQIR